MKAFLKYLEQRNSEIKDCLGNIPLKRRVDLDDAFFAKADELLKAAETAVVNKADYLRRIAKERAVIDYIRLSRRAELKPVEQKMVMERLEKNYRMACEDYLSENDAVQKAMNKLQIFFKGLQANIPVAEEFKESNVMVDLAWPQLKPHYHSKLIDVSDAAGGKAIVLKDKKHKGILQFGFYNVTDKKQVHNITIKRQLLPQDEKFHFYPIGKVTLSPKSYVWAHGSWEIQRKLSEFYESNGMPNDYEIFISIKVQGPAYVTGSKKQNAVMVDRILLIRPQQGESSPSGIQLPSELAKRKVAHDLTWQRLKAIPAHKVSMEPDADSAAKVALKLGNNMGIKHGILQYGLYDIVGKKMLSSRKVAKAKLAQDEKFHLYSLGKIKLSPSCYIWAHPSCRIQRNLKEFYQPDGDNNYEVFVSLKVQGPAYVPGSNKENAVLMDRILLVR